MSNFLIQKCRKKCANLCQCDMEWMYICQSASQCTMCVCAGAGTNKYAYTCRRYVHISKGRQVVVCVHLPTYGVSPQKVNGHHIEWARLTWTICPSSFNYPCFSPNWCLAKKYPNFVACESLRFKCMPTFKKPFFNKNGATSGREINDTVILRVPSAANFCRVGKP